MSGPLTLFRIKSDASALGFIIIVFWQFRSNAGATRMWGTTPSCALSEEMQSRVPRWFCWEQYKSWFIRCLFPSSSLYGKLARNRSCDWGSPVMVCARGSTLYLQSGNINGCVCSCKQCDWLHCCLTIRLSLYYDMLAAHSFKSTSSRKEGGSGEGSWRLQLGPMVSPLSDTAIRQIDGLHRWTQTGHLAAQSRTNSL